MTTTSTEYCADQVRRFDRDRYLTALSAPSPARAHILALFAFNLEVAKTAEVVSEAMLGQIRLQWWREALDEMFDGRPRRHEVVLALAAAHAERPLDRDRFERILLAREADLEDEPMVTLDDLRAYARHSAGELLHLAAGMLHDDAAAHAGAVEHAAMAYALARLLRAVPYHAARGRCYLPREMLARYGLSSGDLKARRKPEALVAVARELAGSIGDHIAQARHDSAQRPKALLPVLLPVSLAELDLSLLNARGYDLFAEAPVSEAWRRPLRIAWQGWRGRF